MVLKRWQIFIGIAFLVAATAASALSLGRVRGTALVGRGLDLSVQSQMEAQEATPDANCFAADVFYGDVRVSPNNISVSPERTNPGELRIRVRTSSIVDEPVVTLFLRVGCNAAVSRRYVLLAEAISDAEQSAPQPFAIAPATTNNSAPPAAAPRVAFGGAASAPSSASGAPANVAGGSNRDRAAERSARRQAERESRAAAAARTDETLASAAADMPKTAPPASLVRKPQKVSGPRLQLDLLDLTASEPQLRSSFEMTSAPTADATARSQAQALWRSLNASPEDAMRDSLRLETLETQMRAALEQSKRQGEDIAALSTDLLAAQRARYLNPFTIFLGLLSLVAVGMSLLLWRRSQSKSGPWWGAEVKNAPDDEQHLWGHLVDGVNSPSSLLDQGHAVKTELNGASTRFETPKGAGAHAAGARRFADGPNQQPQRQTTMSSDSVDFKPSLKSEASASGRAQALGSSEPPGRSGGMGRVDSTPSPSLMSNSAGRSAPKSKGFALSDFAPGGFNNSRLVDAEELFDIQEQADFFLSLGQPEQAIEVLKNHITDNVETSAVAYMDLFDIYHGAGREADYADLREEFNRVFNAQVPEFTHYGAQSNGLEDFPEVLNKIELAWRQPDDAQSIIEESIFRQPDQFQQPLDMSAYRELMLLYALAKELGRPGARFDMLPVSMQSAALPPLAVDKPPVSAEIDFGDDLVFALPDEDMLSLVDDPTLNLPKPLLAPSPKAADGTLDFDLSESELGEFTLPKGPQKS